MHASSQLTDTIRRYTGMSRERKRRCRLAATFARRRLSHFGNSVTSNPAPIRPGSHRRHHVPQAKDQSIFTYLFSVTFFIYISFNSLRRQIVLYASTRNHAAVIGPLSASPMNQSVRRRSDGYRPTTAPQVRSRCICGILIRCRRRPN